MSHFSVLVATKTADDLAAELQPYHEFECTGIDDQYVVEIDETEKLRAEFAQAKTSQLIGPDGKIISRYDDICYRDPTAKEIAEHGPFMGTGFGRGLSYTSKDWGDGRGYRAKIHEVPAGYVEQEVLTSSVETFAEWASGWTGRGVVKTDGTPIDPDADGDPQYGRIVVDDAGEVLKIIDRTNPNKKWDWWQIGGRWSGHLRLRNGSKADQAIKRDVDFDGMMAAEREEASLRYDQAARIINGETFESWKSVLSRHENKVDEAREVYWAQPAVKRLSESETFRWNRDDFECFLQPRGAYIDKTASRAVGAFALLYNGVWHERGEMGWWATVTDDKGDDWPAEYHRLLSEIPDDYVLTVVDCHI